MRGGFYGTLMIQEQGCTKHKTFTNSSSNCATNGLNKLSHKRILGMEQHWIVSTVIIKKK
jgi:hypothetical protein